MELFGINRGDLESQKVKRLLPFGSLPLYAKRLRTWVKNTTLGRLFGDPEINMAGLQYHYLPRTNVHAYTHDRLIICLETHFRMFSKKT